MMVEIFMSIPSLMCVSRDFFHAADGMLGIVKKVAKTKYFYSPLNIGTVQCTRSITRMD